jgi:hypothetical protein
MIVRSGDSEERRQICNQATPQYSISNVSRRSRVLNLQFAMNPRAILHPLPSILAHPLDIGRSPPFPLVDVASEHAHGIIAKLKRAHIKGHDVKVKVA